MTSTVVDYENLLTTSFSDENTTVRSGVRARWERKRLQAKVSGSSLPESSSRETETRQPLGSHNGQQCGTGDRFIPNRGGMDLELSAHHLRSRSHDDEDSVNSECSFDSYKSALGSAILGVEEGDAASSRILSFQDKAPTPSGDTVNNMKILYSSSAAPSRKAAVKSVSRHIPNAPSRILDAPDLLDDYYLNLISWSDSNVLAVALSQTVYLWNASTGNIKELCTFNGAPNSHISSVSWVQEGGAHLAVGTSAGSTQLWDVDACKQLRSMDGHSDRVGALSWNRHILSSGGRDAAIVNHDVRVARHNVATHCDHTQEICGLSWSPDGTTLASGANDNRLCLWDASASSSSGPKYSLTDHQAAVKALAWSPHERNVLATGGGTADRCIKFWNSQTGALLNSIDTGSQVCSLVWNPFEKEILSSHGFARNQLCIWKYPTMAKVKELEGHTARVLHMACSPDGGTVVSAAADETLRFWNVFAPTSKSSSSRLPHNSGHRKGKKLSKSMHIR
eukprot:CAMPEP_0172487060 /NCGR_PEP_ID=MMETSP1066-20121228/15908_1 /TAXON_ID=671091 /ORGANISM="Coscinodiscus wailesii, Strain CCMP2513" /LENGTH=507 /DNA_ID=CAMNT_0013253419 /DNA_START=84 /DNA_END=1607 /DNA_ORIENTATION=+